MKFLSQETMPKEAIRELALSLLKLNKQTKDDIEKAKLKWAAKYKAKIPLNSSLLSAVNEKEREKLCTILRIKPTRTLSGVSTIAIMTKPMGCPGKCTYCPTSKIAAKSYTGFEPSAMRAKLNDWDSYKIVKNRLAQLQAVGHSTNKNEVIIQGGTFTWLPWKYQYDFIKRAFDAFNDRNAKDLVEAQKINETANNRVVSLIIETRPDFCSEKHIRQLLQLGVTRVELGLQSVYDDVLLAIKRGHSVQECKNAIKELKDAGFKVDLHIMIGLPKSTKKKDIRMFEILFEDEDFRPDGLKIYPVALLEGTELYRQWKRGEYKPINEKYIIDVLSEVKAKYIPPYCRIKRIMRDIPSTKISAGYDRLNLREFVQQNIHGKGLACRCIRCREVGQKYKLEGKLPKKVQLKTIEYEASGGKEFFISFEDAEQDILLGFARLRLTGEKAFLRELHVYGESVPIAGKIASASQHKGLGKKLLAEAEKIAKKHKYNELSVLSGAGVKE
ncbi:MAG: tRNA uridine(34) 5-carboxymethylaminomethyl modification radical SAM/GNAT enzyme Elp3 [DPANN group archaeon]|nr:tRNA uridine(34) 5-carboxymethylaminomethyl modification radical SAM/GNAT enzyme Elp3 [DPANN group archaeon]